MTDLQERIPWKRVRGEGGAACVDQATLRANVVQSFERRFGESTTNSPDEEFLLQGPSYAPTGYTFAARRYWSG